MPHCFFLSLLNPFKVVMFCFFLFSKEDQLKAILTGALLAGSVVVGIYVRFWMLSGVKKLRFELDEEDPQIPRGLLREAYRDRILSHDVVQDFYSEARYMSSASLTGSENSVQAQESDDVDLE
jgi:hypothetical protein